jgi:hypothetical protein
VRLLAALALPPLLALGIAFGAMRLVGDQPTSPRTRAPGIVWGKRTFVSRAELARWLNSRGRSYQAWARRHPVEAKADPPGHRAASVNSAMVLGGIAVLSVGGFALLVGRRRPPLRRQPGRVRQPRLAPSYGRAHATILLFWRRHPDLAWYVAGGALAAGGALVVAGWG